MTQTKNLGVLLVDDEAHVRLLMKNVLRSLNFEIVGEAENGRQAVEMFQKTKPDLTLLDINMPVQTGIEALGNIINHNPDAFVIMMTSVSDRESVEECIKLGAFNYIRKDTPLAEIKSMIQESCKEFQGG